jgi:hypothetical protein
VRKWLVIGVVILLIAAGAAAFYARPLLAVRDLKAALQARDPQAVAPRVDFPTLKANVSAAKKDKIEQQNDGKVLEGLRNWVGAELVDGAIDRVGTPEGLIRLACDGKTDGLPTPRGAPCSFQGHVDHYEYLSGDRFRIDVRKADGKAMGLVMGQTAGSRRWRLVDLLDVPSKKPASHADSSS